MEPEGLDRAKADIDAQLMALFRRWPELSNLELAELHCLYDERLRLARHSGARRRSRGFIQERRA